MGRGNSRLPFVSGGVYHIYNRGFNSSIIFENKYCFDKFIGYLFKFLGGFSSIRLLSYCVIDNHFHLVLQNTGEDSHDISMFMKKLQGSYSIWHRRNFPLENDYRLPFFEGRFKSTLIKDDDYLIKCIAFVNYNPLKHGLTQNIKNYPYTSFNKINTSKIIAYKDIDLKELEY